MKETVVEAIHRQRIVIVYRGLSAEDCLAASRVLADAGIGLFEVTTNSPDPAGSIRLLRSELGDAARIGAGTVTSEGHVTMAADAGAEYIVSPHMNPVVIRRSRELGLASIPGAFTPTEVLSARDAGADMVKIFPIKSVGADHLRQLAGPIDDVAFVASGGVDAGLMPDLFAAGAAAVAVGPHLIAPGAIAARDWRSLSDGAARFRAAAGLAR